MNYDFDKQIDRRNSGSLKWDVADNELALWVADMDFETAPCIKDAICNRALHGIFGYSVVTDKWSDSYVNWWKKRHNLNIDKDALIFCTGIVPAISSCVRKLTTPAEKVLIQTPCYNIFFNSIVNNGRVPLESPLSFDGSSYSMDFERLEKDLSDPQVSLMILCNPQNPTGNIWNTDELRRVGELCRKYGVTVISDEIHCDIVRPGYGYVPFASVSETCAEISVSCLAPSKCFNIAGINSAAVMVPNPVLRHKVCRALNTDEVAEPNAFAVDATIAAFMEGEDWLNQLNDYLFNNRNFAEEFIAKEIPGFTVIKGDSTYLLWVKLGTDSDGNEINADEFAEALRRETGLRVNGGCEYGRSGDNFIRINLACPRAVLTDALMRLKSYCAK